MSYIIRNGELIATTSRHIKSGAEVIYAYTRAEEQINADREYNLINSYDAKISNAKKWDKELERNMYVNSSIEINDLEFYIPDCCF